MVLILLIFMFVMVVVSCFSVVGGISFFVMFLVSKLFVGVYYFYWYVDMMWYDMMWYDMMLVVMMLCVILLFYGELLLYFWVFGSGWCGL